MKLVYRFVILTMAMLAMSTSVRAQGFVSPIDLIEITDIDRIQMLSVDGVYYAEFRVRIVNEGEDVRIIDPNMQIAIVADEAPGGEFFVATPFEQIAESYSAAVAYYNEYYDEYFANGQLDFSPDATLIQDLQAWNGSGRPVGRAGAEADAYKALIERVWRAYQFASQVSLSRRTVHSSAVDTPDFNPLAGRLYRLYVEMRESFDTQESGTLLVVGDIIDPKIMVNSGVTFINVVAEVGTWDPNSMGPNSTFDKIMAIANIMGDNEQPFDLLFVGRGSVGIRERRGWVDIDDIYIEFGYDQVFARELPLSPSR